MFPVVLDIHHSIIRSRILSPFTNFLLDQTCLCTSSLIYPQKLHHDCNVLTCEKGGILSSLCSVLSYTPQFEFLIPWDCPAVIERVPPALLSRPRFRDSAHPSVTRATSKAIASSNHRTRTTLIRFPTTSSWLQPSLWISPRNTQHWCHLPTLNSWQSIPQWKKGPRLHQCRPKANIFRGTAQYPRRLLLPRTLERLRCPLSQHPLLPRVQAPRQQTLLKQGQC